jgi:hypothetical protein
VKTLFSNWSRGRNWRLIAQGVDWKERIYIQFVSARAPAPAQTQSLNEHPSDLNCKAVEQRS